MPNRAVIALDLGGTKLAGALFTPAGKILFRNISPLAGRQGREVGALIRRELRNLFAAAQARRLDVTGIGVSVPGISYAKRGTVWAPNIPGWEKYPLRREIQAELRGRPIRLTLAGDRACYILGETWHGAARGCRNAIFLAVGTGIGAGILVDGKVLHGAHDIAGAIGWLALDRPFRKDYVGCGCFEYHASGTGLVKVASEFAGRGSAARSPRARTRAAVRTAHDVFAAYERGDGVAKTVIGQAVEFWGMAVANLVSLFDPETILFGGGVFGPARRFLKDIHSEAKKWAQPISIRKVKLQASKLGSDAGLYGAARLALEPAEED